MPYSQRILPNYTYEDWVHWEGRWELIDGIPIAVYSTSEPLHQRITGNICIVMHNTLKKSKCKKYLTYPSIDYKVSDNTVLEPDVLFVRGEIEKEYLDFPPAIAIEVSSVQFYGTDIQNMIFMRIKAFLII